MNTLMRLFPIIRVAGPSSSHKAVKTIALLLVFCIADVYVLANARKPNTSARDTATNITPGKTLLGRLFVPYHREILVNGHSAMSGDTIISGSHLQTDFTGATVQIASIGELEIAPITDLSLTFDLRGVAVKIAAGNATLRTSDGVKGEVVMPDGEVCQNPKDPFKPHPIPPKDPPGACVIFRFGMLIGLVTVAGVLPPLLRDECRPLVASPVTPCVLF